MMYCSSCGNMFETPDIVSDFTSEYFGSQVTHFISVCPSCGSDEIEDAVKCDICGEWSTDRICERCEEEISGLVSEIHELIAQRTADRDLDMNELIIEISERI